tara:strand:+ start:50 stop:904 length:855 start_codon:yes stop_codon:yes gene_type:complete
MYEVIKKVGNKYVLYPKKGGKRLGTHNTKKAARNQEKAVKASKYEHIVVEKTGCDCMYVSVYERVDENQWSKKYKKKISCSNPKGFSQKAHCAGRKARQRGEKTISKSVSEGIKYHLENKIPFHDNIYRMYSENYFRFFNESRKIYKKGKLENLHWFDEELLKTDLGKVGIYEGKRVPLDIPMKEAEYRGRKVNLNKPMRQSSGKKFKVYVKDPKSGNVRKVSFGASGGGGSLSVKLKDPKAKKAFKDRHNCEQKKDKTKAGYWACRLPRYAKSLGLSGGGQWW